MNCLRCGKETVGNQVFCGDCLETMKHFPVKPGTPVQIPQRKPRSPEKKQNGRQRKLSDSEQNVQYRKMIRWLTITVAVLSAVLCLMVVLLLLMLEGQTFADLLG